MFPCPGCRNRLTLVQRPSQGHRTSGSSMAPASRTSQLQARHLLLRICYSWECEFPKQMLQKVCYCCCCSVMPDSLRPHGLHAAQQACLLLAISQSLHKLMSTESVMPSSHLILCHSLLLLPSIFSSIRVFSNESTVCSRWSKYWSFSFSISPSSEHSELISFRIDWFDLLETQETTSLILTE